MGLIIVILCLIGIGYGIIKISQHPKTCFKFVCKLFLWFGIGLTVFMVLVLIIAKLASWQEFIYNICLRVLMSRIEKAIELGIRAAAEISPHSDTITQSIK